MPVDREALRAWVESSCRAQGVPILVADSGVVSDVGVLLTGSRRGGETPAGVAARRVASQSPGRDDSVRVEGSRPGGAGLDGGVVEDRADDGGLPGEVEALPLVTQRVPVADEPVDG